MGVLRSLTAVSRDVLRALRRWCVPAAAEPAACVQEQDPAARRPRASKAPDLAPERGTVQVGGRPHVVRCGNEYRRKSGGFWRDSVRVERIVDREGREVEAVWGARWRQVAPGISTRALTGSYADAYDEIAPKQAVRIDRSACPVRIEYRRVEEYEDYDDSRYSSRHEERWVTEYVAREDGDA